MPEGDKGGIVGVKPLDTSAIKSWEQLMHAMIKTNPPILRRAKNLSYAARRARGR